MRCGWFRIRSGSLSQVRSRFPEVQRDIDDIRIRLIAIEEDLAEVALARLRDAIDDGGSSPVLDERRVTRARRAIEKAIVLLGDAGGTDLDDV